MTLELLAAAGLAIIHLLAGRLRFLDVVPRSRWLSFAGGVSVAYALVHLLPELERHSAVFAEATGGLGLEDPFYLVVLAGLAVFYGLERLVSRQRSSAAAGEADAVFWIHIGSFAVYNALIGYALVQEDRGMQSLLFFFLALGLHFVVNDFGLRQHHHHLYDRLGRWILSCSILVGTFVGVLGGIPETVATASVGFLAGGILLNTFKEELPKERESRFWAFAAGAAAFAGILLAV